VTTASGTDYRHYIRAGGSTIIVSRQSSGTNSINYVTSDHLGSSSAITNSAGGILVNSSFDAFGRRRGSSWTGNPSAGDWTAIASTTRRGFTEHTMLDNLNLTHMNGRVYDQVVGRFMSSDPFVQFPTITQSFNRYSYVRNNPLSSTDPSGFLELWQQWARTDGSMWRTCGGDGLRCTWDYTLGFDGRLSDYIIANGRNQSDHWREYDGPTVTRVADVSNSDTGVWSGVGPAADSTPFGCDAATPDCQQMVDYIDELKGEWSANTTKELEDSLNAMIATLDQQYGRDVIDEKGNVHKAGGDLPPEQDPRYRDMGSKALNIRATEAEKRRRANFAEDQRKRFEEKSVNERTTDPAQAKRDWAIACSWLIESDAASGTPLPNTVCDR
jgi:RHS repeat-associated protein